MRRRFLVFLPVLLAAATLRTGLASEFPTATQREQAVSKTVIWSGAEVGNVQSISPDGRMLAYIDRSQQPGVGIRDLSTGTKNHCAGAGFGWGGLDRRLSRQRRSCSR
jgi:hypothetical protein